MRPSQVVFVTLCLICIDLPLSYGHVDSTEAAGPACFESMPLHFIENQGQLDGEAAYYIQGSNKNIFFTSEGITLLLKGRRADGKRGWAVKLDFVGANPQVKPRGEAQRKGVFSYFKGKAADWKTGIPSFGKLVYRDLWPGIDLVYSGTMDCLKYEFVVRPGADPKQIRLAYRGASKLALAGSGVLRVETPSGGFEDGAPYAYQIVDGKRKAVSMAYALDGDQRGPAFHYGFATGDYDPEATLVLDPALHVYCGYLGGTLNEISESIAVDHEGNAYVTGNTLSDELTFPVLAGPDLTFNDLPNPYVFGDAYVAKVSADGSQLLYCGYIGGADSDVGQGIAVDSLGRAVVVGYTASDETTFPVVLGPDLTFGQGYDAFIARVCADGTSLDYCGYLGGTGEDEAYDVALDDLGRAYVTGETTSTDFPVVVGPDLVHGALHDDLFVTRVSADGSRLEYSGFIGGDDQDHGSGIAVDSAGCAYVTGRTRSTVANGFPALVGPCLVFGGDWDALVAKVSADGSQLLYCGYIGGVDDDSGYGIAVDGAGNAYVTGKALSLETSFPVLAGPDLTYNGGSSWYGDAFVAKVRFDGTQLDYCGYMGGSGWDSGEAIDVDAQGRAVVGGFTASTEVDFPVISGPDLTYNGGYNDGFVARVSADGVVLDWCGFLGGSDGDVLRDLVLDDQGGIYVTGNTTSTEADFPVRVGPCATHSGPLNSDAFVAKLGFTLRAAPYALSAATGGVVDFTLEAGTAQTGRNYYLLGSVSGTEPGLPLPGWMVTLPLNWDVLTDITVGQANGPALINTRGLLNAGGNAGAQLNTNGPLPPNTVGAVLYFSYLLYYPVIYYPYDFVSNPVAIEILP